MEEFSGIPVKALLENDEKTTELDLRSSGCGVLEACVLSYCLKVIVLCLFVCCLCFAGYLVSFIFVGGYLTHFANVLLCR